MKTTTLNELNKHHPCVSGWRKLLKNLGKTKPDDEKLSFITILESNGIADAIWCLRVLPDYDLDVMKLKLLCARRVEHFDKTGTAKATLDMVERFINGAISKEELKGAYSDAVASADAVAAVDAASAYAAAAYADAVASAVAAAAYASDAYAAAAYADAVASASAYASAAYADAASAYAAAAYADAAAEREYQAKIFREIFG